MHPLLAKLTGRPSVKNLDVELEGIEKKLSRFRQATEPAQDYPAFIATAAKAFIDSPTPERCKAWIQAEAARQGAFEVVQRMRDYIISLRGELLSDLRPQIRAAIDDLSAGLTEQKQKVLADDAAKSIEYGEEVHSTAVLASLDKKIEQLEQAKGWVDSDPSQSISAIRTVIG